MMTMNPPSTAHGTTPGSCGGDLPGGEILCTTLNDGAIALVRVVGRGSHLNAASFKKFADVIQDAGGAHKFVLDLDPCETLDSTFLGVLAAVALRQKAGGDGSLIVLNVNSHVQRILKTMGLIHVLDVRENSTSDCPDMSGADQALRPVEEEAMSRVDQICLRLQAHKDLAELDPENKGRFESVITYLEHSLEREKAKKS